MVTYMFVFISVMTIESRGHHSFLSPNV